MRDFLELRRKVHRYLALKHWEAASFLKHLTLTSPAVIMPGILGIVSSQFRNSRFQRQERRGKDHSIKPQQSEKLSRSVWEH
jgi:hypothetical protein